MNFMLRIPISTGFIVSFVFDSLPKEARLTYIKKGVSAASYSLDNNSDESTSVLVSLAAIQEKVASSFKVPISSMSINTFGFCFYF